MASPVSDTIYIKADKNTEVTKPDVTLGDVLKIECANPSVLSRVKTLKLLKFHHKDNKKQNRTAVSILKVIACIHEVYPNVEVQKGSRTLSLHWRNRRRREGSCIGRK